jgi:hypothetical protein
LVGFTQAAPGVVTPSVGVVVLGLVVGPVPGIVVVVVVVPGPVVVVVPGTMVVVVVVPGTVVVVIPGTLVVVVGDGVVPPVLAVAPGGPQSAPVERFTPPR